MVSADAKKRYAKGVSKKCGASCVCIGKGVGKFPELKAVADCFQR